MRNPAEYIDYMRSLVETYSEVKTCFIMDLNETLHSLKNTIEYPALVLNTYDGTFTDRNRDGKLNMINAGFLLVENISEVDDFEKIREVLERTYLAAAQVIEKMKYDADHCNIFIKGFVADSVRYQMVGPVFENAFGFLFTFTVYADPVEFIPSIWE